MRSPAALLALVLLAGSCGGPSTPPPEVSVQRHDKWAHRIDDEATWRHLAARPMTQAVAHTEVVKFLIDLRDDRRIYFIDTELYDVHFFFAREFLSTRDDPVDGSPAGHARFNVQEYRRDDRRFVLGTIAHYLDSDVWAMEMIAGDTLPGERVLRAFQQIQSVTFFGDRLRYRPISELHVRNIAPLGDRLPVVQTSEVFAGVRYQPLTLGPAFGTLRVVRGRLDPSSVRPDQVLVLQEIPDELPVAAGVITAQLQAPLGHLAILCSTRSTPNMGLRDALEIEEVTSLEGQLVALDVGAQDYSLRRASRQEAEAAWARRRPAQAQVPLLSADDVGLQELCDLRIHDTLTAGAKAAQLGELCGISEEMRVPAGFVIPFHEYIAHVRRAGIAAGIDAMLVDDTFRSDARVRADNLAQLRAAIERAPVDAELLRTVTARIATLGATRVILRSSTNAEDLPGFTGAGLYRSIVVEVADGPEAIASALRKVWASLWLTAAFEERQWYRIAHAQTAMAVLVQRFVDEAVGNGVAITANPFYEARPGVFINVQVTGATVTGAGGDEIPEQHLVYTYSQRIEPEVLSRSSLTDRPVMREEEVVRLTQMLLQLHDHFLPLWGAERANAADVEFLVAGPDRHIVMLQARPFNVLYAPGQRWED